MTDVTASKAVNLFNHYGIDEEGPVPDMQSDYAVSVPDTITTLTHNQELSLLEADAVFQTAPLLLEIYTAQIIQNLC